MGEVDVFNRKRRKKTGVAFTRNLLRVTLLGQLYYVVYEAVFLCCLGGHEVVAVEVLKMVVAVRRCARTHEEGGEWFNTRHGSVEQTRYG